MRLFRAPGRVNLIGEHTDYSGGFVLPVAIQLATTVAHTPRTDGRLVVRSENLEQTAVIDLASRLAPTGTWIDYVAGVAEALIAQGCRLRGGDLAIASTVPRGAGLSSSAALEVAAALAMTTDAQATISRLQLAQCCQAAENRFVGARCGIMDQFVACFAQEQRALLIDCRSLQSRVLPIPTGAAIVVLNTMVKHAHATGEYNARRADCETAAELLARRMPHVQALRDVSVADLAAHGEDLSTRVFKRARHVATENQRVLDAAAALDISDLERVGRLMGESHASLRDDFEVSAPELDLMVDLAASEPGAFGTRMTGGGFGGCTVSLVDAAQAERFVHSMQHRYAERTATRPDAWICEPSAGAHEVLALR